MDQSEEFLKKIKDLFSDYSKNMSFSDLINLTKDFMRKLRQTEKDILREIAMKKAFEEQQKREQKKICEQCNALFIYGRSNARFCSTLCAARNFRKKRLLKLSKFD